MKKILIVSLSLFTFFTANAQHKKSDTLLVALKTANTDTARFVALVTLSRHYFLSYPDSGIIFAQKGYDIAEKNNWASAKGFALKRMADAYGNLGDYVKSMQYYFRALRTYESINDFYGAQTVNNNIGSTYIEKQDYKSALSYLYIAKKQLYAYSLSHKSGTREYRSQFIVFLNLGETYLLQKRVDSADYYFDLASKGVAKIKNKDVANEFMGNLLRDLGEVAALKGNKQLALKYFRSAVSFCISNSDMDNLSGAYLGTAKLYHQHKQQDSAEYFARKAIDVAVAGKFEQDVLNAGMVLYKYYDEDNNLPEAYKYYRITTEAKDSLYSQDKVKQLLSLDFDERQHKADIAAAREQYRASVRMYSLIAGLAVVLVLSFIFWRNGNQRKKANQLLQQQKEEIQNTLGELKTTQTQLIQSEKMASLGELTAGIAHEIQNPLNFVNNFSEVNTELLAELKQEISAKNYEEVSAIADDLIGNEQKINLHGKRADAIVKGMLQHSQSGSGAKEPTNINSLADEYLRLSYHGLRSKDKSFNAEMVKQFDEKLPQINVIPRDIGRVMLNLFNNAFYAVNQKQKKSGEGYKPEVSVSTSLENGQVAVKVKDNGVGIPDAVKDKIMQPFFTTKPTGEGTGLGLSLTYDMVVKGHGGSIKVNSVEGEGAEFIIQLPIT